MNKTNLEKIKFEERKALLSMFYQSGFDYLKVKEYKSTKEWKEFRESKEFKDLNKFRNLINEEAKKRNIKPLELIRQLVENNILYNRPSILEETIELLEKKKIKKLLPKFSKIYTHSEMENIKGQILKPGKLIKTGRKTINEDYASGEVEIWRSKDVEYYSSVEDAIKLKGNPKVSVSQLKNISLLTLLTQEQQFNNSTKEAKCEFKLSYYAERRGYTKEEIKRGGIIFEELRRDLFSGAFIAYRINNREIIKDNEYIRHGISSFYDLLEPIKDHSGINWIVEFKDYWEKWIMEILEGGAEQFFIEERKAIEDRYTTERPYLFLFYRQLIKRKRANLDTMPIKIGNLLKDMKLPEDILARPRDCFNLLKECLIYFSENYKPTPELESFNIYNDFHKTKTVKLPLGISEAFKEYPYEDFKDLLKVIGIKDIRESYISFKRPYVKPKNKKKQDLNEEEQSFLDKTLKWFNDPSNPNKITIPLKDQESLVKRYIKKYGVTEYERLFKREGNKFNANAVEFLTKVLPNFNPSDERNDHSRPKYTNYI